MRKPTKQVKEKPVKQNARDKQRGFGVIELLFAATTLGTTLLVAAMNSSKKPPGWGD